MINRRLKHAEGYAMPPAQPEYPPLPTQYRDVRFQLVYFRAAEHRIAEFLPEPLEPAPGGLGCAFTIDVPFSSDYGPFQESGVQEQVLFQGQPAFYVSHLFLNNVPAILSGRERWGAPKVYADVRFEQHDNVLIGTTDRDGVRLMTLTSTLGEPATEKDLIPMFPSLRLKIIPRADGPGPAIKQLISAAPVDATTHLLYKGEGTVAFGRSARVDLTPLQPLEIVAAFYQVAGYTETYGEIVYDYLAD